LAAITPCVAAICAGDGRAVIRQVTRIEQLRARCPDRRKRQLNALRSTPTRRGDQHSSDARAAPPLGPRIRRPGGRSGPKAKLPRLGKPLLATWTCFARASRGLPSLAAIIAASNDIAPRFLLLALLARSPHRTKSAATRRQADQPRISVERKRLTLTRSRRRQAVS